MKVKSALELNMKCIIKEPFRYKYRDVFEEDEVLNVKKDNNGKVSYFVNVLSYGGKVPEWIEESFVKSIDCK